MQTIIIDIKDNFNYIVEIAKKAQRFRKIFIFVNYIQKAPPFLAVLLTYLGLVDM